MKIAELSTRYPPGPGGVERHVHEISRRFAGRGHDVSVFTTELYREFPWQPLDRTVPRREVSEGVRVTRLPAFSLPGELHYPFFRGLLAELERARPDVVHVHTYGTHQVAVARRLLRRRGIPFVLTAHYHPIWSIEGGWLRHRLRGFYDRRLAGPLVAAAARVVVQGREEERLLRANGLALPPVVTIPPGLTPGPAELPDRRTLERALGVQGPFLLFVGRLASNKGLLHLVEAFATLGRHDPTAELVLLGEDGGMRSKVEARVAALGLSGRVRFPGFVADEALLGAAFAAARLFVLPSDYEAFGLVLLEALARGTPVVASRVGGIPEVVEEGRAGRLVAPGDAPGLAQALVDLWDDEATRARFGEYGRTEVAPRYSWDRVVDRLEAVFGEVIPR
ncbi:MAG TPA: glycosyltransferase family 4 protein [Thermoplasmata archaeon]|nr:glycosyltransferase family 4 protein [Thermoplasmata archaeon]